MGNAFVAGLKNEAPRGRDVTNEDRNSEASQRGTQRDAEGSEFSYRMIRLSVTLNDLYPTFSRSRHSFMSISVKRARLKDKLLLHYRKLYVTYGMLLCFLTFIDR